MPAPLDIPILKLFSEYVHLQVSMICELTGRSDTRIRKRLVALARLGFLRKISLPDDQWGEPVWFALQPAWDFALEEGWVKEHVEASDEKTNKNLRHDLRITQLHLTLNRAYGSNLRWSQHHLYRRFGTAENDRVNPDAFFSLSIKGSFFTFFVEVENSGENKYKDGKSSRIRKMEAYAAYADGPFQEQYHFPNFRVLTLLPSSELVLNFCDKMKKLGAPLDGRRYWATSYDDLSRITDKVFHTPRDSGDVAYSFADC